MSIAELTLIASFSTAESLGTNPSLVLWLLPLAASIAIVYKATKLPTIKAANFIKEAAILFGSILVFIIISALVLHALTWLVTQ
ncbi:MAG: hypothetical protein ACYTBJ_09380 [Planctomycetota bacterium]|jgi:hypothetical protein